MRATLKLSVAVVPALGMFLASTVFAQSEPRLDPDSPEAKSMETVKRHGLRISSESVLIEGGNYLGQVIATFYMDRTLVTVRQYRACVEARVCKEPPITGNWSATTTSTTGSTTQSTRSTGITPELIAIGSTNDCLGNPIDHLICNI